MTDSNKDSLIERFGETDRPAQTVAMLWSHSLRPHQRDIYQCENCGRLWVQSGTGTNDFHPFLPDTPNPARSHGILSRAGAQQPTWQDGTRYSPMSERGRQSLLDAAAIIRRHDPLGRFNAPRPASVSPEKWVQWRAHDYASESESLLGRFARFYGVAHPPEVVRRVVYGWFIDFAFPDSPGTEEDYTALAADLWTLWCSANPPD